MLEGYRTLRAMRELGEFTASELAARAGVKATTVRTVLAREDRLVDKVGTVRTGDRGGQPIRYRVRADAARELADRVGVLDGIAAPPPVPTERSGVPSALLAAVEMLLDLHSVPDHDRGRQLSLAWLGFRRGQAALRAGGDDSEEVRLYVDAAESLLRLAELEDLVSAELTTVPDEHLEQLARQLTGLREVLPHRSPELLVDVETRVEQSPLASRLAPPSPVRVATHVRARHELVDAVLAEIEREHGVRTHPSLTDSIVDSFFVSAEEWDAAYARAEVDLETIRRTLRASLARAAKVALKRSNGGGNAIQARVRQLRHELANTESEFDREKLLERIGKLTGGVAVIKVGGATETEMKERKHRVEDAVQAVRAALEEGILPGGGVALVRAADAIRLTDLEGDERAGASIIARALPEPLRQLAENAGLEGSVVIDKVRTLDEEFGLNVETGRYENLVAAGIVDPTMVTRSVLQNAASVAKNILTAEAAVAESPVKESQATATPGWMKDMM